MRPEAAGRGIGSLLLDHLLSEAARIGATCLHGLAGPELAGFYRGRGFEVTRPGGELVANVQLDRGYLRLPTDRVSVWLVKFVPGNAGPVLVPGEKVRQLAGLPAYAVDVRTLPLA